MGKTNGKHYAGKVRLVTYVPPRWAEAIETARRELGLTTARFLLEGVYARYQQYEAQHGQERERRERQRRQRERSQRQRERQAGHRQTGL